jgi:serine/threonine protein kinase
MTIGAQAMHDRIGQQIGNYRLVRSLGYGGFAEVYLAQNIYIPKQVAIKILHDVIPPQEQIDFIREAQTLEPLKHPHIVQIIDFGIQNGTPYLIMDFAPQGNLRHKHPIGSKVPLTTVVEYIKQIAAALQFAHDHKVIHRDVKPENILLGANNELLLTDFGIATVAHRTVSRQPIASAGTPAYMAPEQLQGQPCPQSDQYAVAIMVYELLTGVRPFNGTTTEIAMQQLTVAPSPLQRFLPTLPDGVQTVVLKALSKDPRQRYASMSEFATALQHPFYDTPTVADLPARSVNQPVLPGTTHCINDEHIHRVTSLIWSADSTRIISRDWDSIVQTWNTTTGVTLNIESIERFIPPELQSPNGMYIALPNDNTVQIWNAVTGIMHTYSEHITNICSVAWAPDSIHVASGDWKGTVQIWNAITGKNLRTYSDHTTTICSVAWSPDSRYIASTNDNVVQIWKAVTGKKLLTYAEHKDKVWALTWSPDSTSIASASEDKTVQVWNATTGKTLLTYSEHRNAIVLVRWSPDSSRIASADKGGTIRIWQAPS